MNISGIKIRGAGFSLAALPLALSAAGVMAQGVTVQQESAQGASAAQAFDAITVMGESSSQETPWATQTGRSELDSLQILNWSQFGSRAEPGVNYNTTTKSINIRGLEGTRVLTRIDGIRQSYLTDVRGDQGGVAGGLNTLDFNSLNQIDVIRGSDSSSVGSGALGGVVDVRTLNPGDLLRDGKPFGALLKTGYYSVDNSWLLNGAFAARNDKGFSWLLQAGVQQGHETINQGNVGGYGTSRTEPNPDNYVQQNYLLKLQQAIDGGHKLGLTASYFNRNDDITDLTANPATYFPGQSYLTEETTRQSIALDYAWAAADSSAIIDTFAAQAYWQDVKLSSDLNANRRTTPQGPYFRGNSIEETTYGLSLDMTKSISGSVSQFWEGGAELYTTRLTQYVGGRDSCPPVVRPFSSCYFFHINQSDIPNTDGNQYGLWLQNTIGFADDTFLVTPAIRYDDYSFSPDNSGSFSSNPNATNLPNSSGQAWSPKLMVTWKPIKDLSVYAQYATGFNAPTATQLYSRFGSPGTYLVQGNPNLDPEKSRGWEFGAKYDNQAVKGSLTYFDNTYTNFIESVTGPGTRQYPFFIQSYENLADVRIYGVEARGEWNFHSNWSVFGSLAWTVGKDRATDTYLNSVAPLTAIFGVAYSAQEWGARAQVTAAAERSNVAYPNATATHPNPDFKAPGYGLVDLTAYWRPSEVKGLTVQAGVFNLFDKTYWNALDVPTAGVNPIARPLDAYTQPGRNFAVSFTYQY
ncbi:TonB-dependent hemoglobin/transferrin/lactoferrin family receptor [Orrella marina]|nr:TonB-dependent hemoglobin/transferrin/lactoferrin family receptor [Orrella marina]